MEIIKSVRPMESLEMDSRFVHRFIRRRRGRDIKEMMCKSGVGELKSGSSLSESPNSGGIQGAGGVGGGDEAARSFVCSSHRSISVIGRRRTMEDEVTVAPGVVMVGESEPYDFFAVYDGHGGAEVANKCRERLHLLVAEEVGGWGRTGGRWGLEGWEKVMSASFARMDEEVDGCDGAEAVESVGSTAAVVLVGREEVVVANCGDSRAVMCRAGVAVPLSLDHKPDRPDERERVEAAGGRVINWHGSRVLGVLATSRSIGDHYLRPYVICEPEVTVTKRTESDDFLVIASDGLWDVVSNKFACEVVRLCLNGQIKRRFSEGFNGSCAADAAAILAEMAMARGSKDNISVIVVELR